MKLFNFAGVDQLTSPTQELIKKADEAMGKVRETESIFEDWKMFEERVLREIEICGEIKNPKAFNKTAQDYMKQTWKQFAKSKDFTERAKQFTYEGYEENMGECLKEYFARAKEYKKAIKAAKKAVVKDPEGTYSLDKLFKREVKDAKSMCKTLRKMNIQEFGLPTNAKIAIFAGAAVLTGLAIWGGIKAYKHVFGTKDNTETKPEETKSPDEEITAQVSDTTQAPAVAEVIPDTDAVTEVPDETAVIAEPEETVVETPEEIPANGETKTTESETKPAFSKLIMPASCFSTYMQADTTITLPPFAANFVPTHKPKETVAETTPAEKETVTESKDTKKEEDRKAYETAITKIREILLKDENVKNIKTESYTVVKNDSFWRIAEKSLINEGIEKPSNKEINRRIALIAILNDVDEVTTHKVRVNQTYLIPTPELEEYIDNNPELGALISEITKYV